MLDFTTIIDEIIEKGEIICQKYAEVAIKDVHDDEDIQELLELVSEEQELYDKLFYSDISVHQYINYIQEEYENVTTEYYQSIYRTSSITRIMRKMHYHYAKSNFFDNGNLVCINNLVTEITYSETLKMKDKYPDLEQDFVLLSYLGLSFSPEIELKALKNNLEPFDFYESDLKVYEELKMRIKAQDSTTNPNATLDTATLCSVNARCEKIIEESLMPDIKSTWEEILTAFKTEENTDLYEILYSFVKFKALLATLQEKSRNQIMNMCLQTINKTYKTEILELLKDSFSEIDEIASRIIMSY